MPRHICTKSTRGTGGEVVRVQTSADGRPHGFSAHRSWKANPAPLPEPAELMASVLLPSITTMAKMRARPVKT